MGVTKSILHNPLFDLNKHAFLLVAISEKRVISQSVWLYGLYINSSGDAEAFIELMVIESFNKPMCL